MKLFLNLLLVLILIVGCSSTKVHLINQGYPTERINSLLVAFEQQNIDAVISKATVPNEFSDVALALNPNNTDYASIEKIKRILAQQQLSVVEEFRFAQGRHFYSGKNIGVYLKDPSITVMPSYLRTQYCSTADATFQFLIEGQFVIEYEVKDINMPVTENEAPLRKLHGDYFFDGQQLKLKVENHIVQKYSFSKQLKDTYLGSRTADVFTPLLKNKDLGVLNCELLIIYMDQT